MNKRLIILAGILGGFAIILGAFGAHGLKNSLGLNELNSFEVGVRYQIYHALFLLIVANFNQVSQKFKKYITYFITIGVLFFSGSIYLLTTQTITNLDFKFLWPVTPLGGIFLIIGWILLIVGAFKSKVKHEN